MKYITRAHLHLSDSFYSLIHKTADRLVQSKYKEGEKFTSAQQTIVTDYGEKLEELVTQSLFPHIFIVRKFKQNECKQLLFDMLKTINKYKRQGVIASLKLFREDVGRNNITNRDFLGFSTVEVSDISINGDTVKDALTRLHYEQETKPSPYPTELVSPVERLTKVSYTYSGKIANPLKKRI